MKYKKIVSILLALMMIFSVQMQSFANTSHLVVDEYYVNIFFLEDYLSDEAFLEASRAYAIYRLGEEHLYNELNGIDIINELYSLLPMDRVGAVIYPEFYAGSFHDPNDGSLIMNIVNNSDNSFTRGNPIYELVAQNNITINFVQFSYSELFDMLHFLDSVLINQGSEYSTVNNPYNLDFIYQISSWGLPTDVNRVVVRFDSNVEENASLFRQHIIDSPMIIFEESPFPMLLRGDLVFEDEMIESTMQEPIAEMSEMNPFNIYHQL